MIRDSGRFPHLKLGLREPPGPGAEQHASMGVGMVSAVTGTAAGGRGESSVREYRSTEWY